MVHGLGVGVQIEGTAKGCSTTEESTADPLPGDFEHTAKFWPGLESLFFR